MTLAQIVWYCKVLFIFLPLWTSDVIIIIIIILKM